MSKNLIWIAALLCGTVMAQSNKPYLGINMVDLEDRPAMAKNYQGNGVVITRVVDNSAAEKAGLQAGDILVSINGVTMKAHRSVADAISNYAPGDSIDLSVVRDGEAISLSAQLEERPFMRNQRVYIADFNHAYVGIEYESLDKQLADFFEVEHGLLVKEVREESPAAEAGIQAGDIIVAWDGQVIKSNSDLSKLLRESEPESPASFTVIRKGREMDITVMLGNREDFLENTFNFKYNFDFGNMSEFKNFEHLYDLKSLESLEGLGNLEGLLDTMENIVIDIPQMNIEMSDEDEAKMREELATLKEEMERLRKKLREKKDP